MVNHCKGRRYAQKSKTKNVTIYNHITYKSINTYYTEKISNLISIQCYNMNTNLLDLNSDILEIIGDYVKKDNHVRIQKICRLYV